MSYVNTKIIEALLKKESIEEVFRQVRLDLAAAGTVAPAVRCLRTGGVAMQPAFTAGNRQNAAQTGHGTEKIGHLFRIKFPDQRM